MPPRASTWSHPPISGGIRTSEDELLQLFGGEFNFYELRLNFRAYQPLDENQRFIFRYNGTLGHLGSTDGTVIPYIHRYRAGGINSVRGYDWFTLGPFVWAFGYKTSARAAFVGSDDPTAADDRLRLVEQKHGLTISNRSPIVRQAGILTVVFLDAGNAFGDPWGQGHINVQDLRFAYGMGIRWLSPMGPLRFEWGYRLDRIQMNGRWFSTFRWALFLVSPVWGLFSSGLRKRTQFFS